ncbi:MAG: HEAT repeat domain-containing protein [Acidimicrobiia bacterium]|nr:HEAT repeat domain-containing protein [Acidimicrobiia bacterium]
MARDGASDPAAEKALALVEAVGTAWTTYTLYPDPSEQPAFTRAVVALAEPLTPPLVVGVGPGRFILGEEELPIRREGAERLAREMFLHDIENIRFVGGATLDGFLGFFRAISLDDEHVRELGGIRTVIREIPATGIQVLQRGLLVLTDDGSGRPAHILTEHMSPAAAAASHGADPDEIASILLAEEGPEFSPEQYFAGLWGLHEQASPLADEDFVPGTVIREGDNDPWREFRSFLESFFFLPRDLQLGVLEAVLEDSTDENHRLFLDQLTQTELAGFLPELTAKGATSLKSYAHNVAEETGRSVSGAYGMVDEDMLPTQQAVSARIAEVLSTVDRDRAGHEELLAALRAEMSAPLDGEELAGAVLRGLFECEYRDDRFARVVRVWTGRVTRHLRTGDLDSAQALLDKVLIDPMYPPERKRQVREGLDKLGRPDVLRFVLDIEDGEELSDGASRFLGAIGTSATDALVAMLAEADDQKARRSITALLVPAVSEDPLCLDNYLLDERWFLLRNLATVLGRTGKQTAVAGVRRLLRHEDQRVRAEALRSLIRLQRDEAAPAVLRLLADQHPMVREAAASLAKTFDSAGFEKSLIREFQSAKHPQEVQMVMVEVLGGRETSASLDAIKKVAHKRLVLRKRDRELRAYAREVMSKAAA